MVTTTNQYSCGKYLFGAQLVWIDTITITQEVWIIVLHTQLIVQTHEMYELPEFRFSKFRMECSVCN